MNQFEKWLWQHRPPVIRNVWLRFLKHFIVASIVSYFLYWSMSQVDLNTIEPFDNKRTFLAYLMLSIMSAKSWGWFFFIAGISAVLWGDWQNFRWQSLPKEKLGARGGDESDSTSNRGSTDSNM